MDQSQNTALSFGCSQCLRRFATKSQVASHCLNAHYLKNALAASASEVNAQCLVLPFRNVQTGRLNKWNCQSCGKVLASEDAFVNHSRRAHDFGCSHCLKHFIVKLDLVPHILEHLPTRQFCEQFAEPRDVWAIERQPSFGCCECLIHFDSKQRLISHLWNKHSRTFSLSAKFVHCKYCCKSFASVWYLNQHMVKHSTERPFKCKWCNKTYRFRSNLYQHNCPLRKESAVKGAWQLNLQPGFKRFRCSVCPFRCALKATLQRHKMIHKRSVETFPEVKGSVSLACNYCPERFDSLDEKYLHESCIHGEVSLVQCNFCEMEFMDEQTRDDHAQKCHIEAAAQCCSSSSSGTAASFATDRPLRSALECDLPLHVAVVAAAKSSRASRKVQRFDCPFCDMPWLSASARWDHVRTAHLGDKPTLSGTGVGMNFTYTSTADDTERMHQCVSCPETFRTSNQLLVHLRTAHGQAHDCAYCFTSFLSDDELAAHLRKKHSSRFACPHCAKLFVRKIERADHMAKVHGGLAAPAQHAPRRSSPSECHVTASPSNVLNGSRKELSPSVQGSSDSLSSSDGLTCSRCALQFRYPSQLRGHWSATHEPYACVLCDATFTGKSNLLHHRKRAHPPEDTHSVATQNSSGFPEGHVAASPSNVLKGPPEEPSPSVQGASDSLPSNDGLSCGKCGLWFQYPSQLRVHWSFTHEPYACARCDETFAGKFNLLHHRSRAHPPDDTHSVASTKDSNGFPESHVTASPSNNFLQVHAKLYPFACVFCEQRFVDAVAADAHISEHDSQHACKHCEKMFDSPTDLAGHVCGAPHPVDLEKLKRWRVSLRCCHCGAAFKDWHRKKHHMIAHHSDKKIKCDFCDRSFWSKNLRRAHMRLVHPDLLSDKARTFFACEYCPRRFCAADVKRLHVRRLHVEQSLTPHECERCGSVFGNTMSLRAHVQDCKKLPLRAQSASAFDKPGRIDDVIDAVRAIVGSTPDAVEECSGASGPSAMHQTNDVIIDGVVYDVCSPEAAGAASDGSPYASNAPTSSSSLGQISADQFQFDQVAGAFSLQPNWFQCEFCMKMFCIDANSFQSHVTNCRGNYESMLISAPFLPLPALQPMPCFDASTNISSNACQEEQPGSAELSGLSTDYATFPAAPPDGSGCFDMPYQTSIIMPCGFCSASFPAFDLLKLHEASEHRCFECPQMFPNGFQRNEHYRLFHVAGASGHVTSTALTFSALQSTSSLLQSDQSANQNGHVSQMAPQGYPQNDEAGMPSNSAHCSNGFGLLMPAASAVASSQPRQVQNTPSANPTGRATQSSSNPISHVAQNSSRNHGNIPVGQAESSNDPAQSNGAIMSASGPINAKIISIQRPKKRSLPPHSRADNVSQASFSFTSTNRASHVTETAAPTTSDAALVFKCDFCADAAPFRSVGAKLYHENEHHRCPYCRATFPGRVSKLVHMTVVHSAQVSGDLPKAKTSTNAILTGLQKLVRRAGSGPHVPTRGRPKKARGNDVAPVVDLTQDSDEEEEKS